MRENRGQTTVIKVCEFSQLAWVSLCFGVYVIGDRPLLFKVWEFPRLAWVSLCFGVTGYGSKSNGSGSPFFLGRPERPGWARLPIISSI